MAFDIHLLNHLDYDEAESLLPDYLDDVVEQFVTSSQGEAYISEHPEVGRWITTFTEMAYVYEGFTLPTMTKAEVQVIMEDLLPRKITLRDRSDAEDAISELSAFWNFLDQEYHFQCTGEILNYLSSIEGDFPDWMFDPAKGGMAKSFLMEGIQAGYDMTTQEGLDAFRLNFNQRLFSENPDNSFLQQLGNLFPGSSSKAQPTSSNSKHSEQPKKASGKGFEALNKGKKSKRRKK